MLQNIHVKNLALIDETDLDLSEGFNVLTGETGAGKSILLGSVALALGGKYQSGILRNEDEPALVELTFFVDDKKVAKALKNLDIETEDGVVVFTRKLHGKKSVGRINGETVPASVMRQAAQLLIDIHGQHDSQALLKQKNHLALLDAYGDAEYEAERLLVQRLYKSYMTAKEEYEKFSMDDTEKLRETDLLNYEISEIEQADLCVGEDEELEEQYALMSTSEKSREALDGAYFYISGAEQGTAVEQVGLAMRQLDAVRAASQRDNIYNTLSEVESLLQDASYAIADLIDELDFSPEKLYEVQQRLDLINRLKARYGRTVTDILGYLEKSKKRLAVLEDYDRERERLHNVWKKSEDELTKACARLTKFRKKAAGSLAKAISAQLDDLHFLQPELSIDVCESGRLSASGSDDVKIMISTNPGEPMRPMADIASGGELSRIMLAFKTVLSDKEDTPTLIFDEIDTGISGITAGKVAEKLKNLGNTRQVICITHLPQIAAAGHSHYYIEKDVRKGRTSTTVRHLDEKESVRELARMLGGENITETLLESARELKGVSL